VTAPLESQLEVAALSGEVEAVMQSIVSRLMEFDQADGASLATVDGEFARFRVCAGADVTLQDRVFPIDSTLGGKYLKPDDAIVLRVDTHPEVARALTPGAGAIALAPIAYDGSVRGTLGVRSADADAFGEAELETIRLLGRAASIALRNAELIEDLAGRERQYRALHAQAADGILVSDREGNLIDANDAAAAMLWYSVDELRSMNAVQLTGAQELEKQLKNRDELLRSHELRGEHTVQRKDGAQIDIEFSSRLLEDGRIHTTMRDVSRRKRNEVRIRSSVERLREIVETQKEISALELDPGAITAKILERTQGLTGADGAAVAWFDGSECVLEHGSGIAAPHVGMRLRRDSSLSGVVSASGEAAYAEDTHADARVDQQACDAVGARSLICAPLYRDGRVDGVLSVFGVREAAFDDLAVETTRLMAEFVSGAMRNSNELEERRRLVEQLRTQGDVVQHMQTGLWVWAQDGDTYRLEYANAAGESALGLAAADIVGRTFEEVLPGATGSARALFRRVAETHEHIDAGEVAYGDERVPPSIFSMRLFPLPEDRIAIAFDNVTEVAEARQALEQSEARFRGAFYSSSLGMALGTLDLALLQVNDALTQMLGYTADELCSLGVRGITHPADLEEDLEQFERFRTGESDSYQREKRYVRKNGSTFWGELTVSLVRTSDGQPAHTVSHVRDISSQKEANLLFEATFSRSVVAKLIADDNRRLVDLNSAAEGLLGVQHDEALDLTIDQLLADESVEDAWEVFLQIGAIEAEVTLHRPDGAKRRVEFAATANVRPGRHVAVVRDLTRQKELEEQLRQAQKMEAVGRLAGGIAHDFNNLLTAITGYSEFLIAGQTDERLRRYAEEIRKAAARAASLTAQLLAFSRRQVLQPRVLDLNGVVSDMDMMLRRLIGEDVELVTVLEPELGSIRADPTQLEQVIVNLAVNARDAMPHGGAVTIETTNIVIDDDALVELRLTDTGIGMTVAERRQLFEPFFTTKDGGTGLGLATVYGVVEQSGGAIEVDSAPGMGSSFRILFPRVEEPAEEPAAAANGEELQRGDETILLVEDELVVRQLVAEILEDSGYSVLQASDGPSALELVRRHTGALDALVTDVVMPGMSGPEVAQAITSMRPGTQILYMSGYTDSAIGHHGVLAPGIAFLQKPFSADDLTRKVRTLLDEAESKPG